MGEILNTLKQFPKELLMLIIFELMRDGKITFHDIAETHAKHLEELREGTSAKLQELVSMIIAMHVDTKRNYGKNLNRIMHYLLDEGRVNTTHDLIDKKHKVK